MDDTKKAYGYWRPDPRYQLPPRSTLACLKPVGIGGPYVESLSSYYFRLAYLHRLSPRVLAKYLIVPEIRKSENLKDGRTPMYWNKTEFNGLGVSPKWWTKQLETFTGVESLSELSFFPLGFLIPKKKFTGTKKKWCPVCYDESLSNGCLYNSLLWEIGAATACPLHGIRLVEACVCDPKSKLNQNKVKRLPGICTFCGRLLTSDSGICIEKADAHEIQKAKLIAEFIADRKALIKLKNVGNQGFSTFLKGVIQNHTNGNASAFGRLVHVYKSKLSEWINNHHPPVFPEVVNIANACNCSITDVYLGKYRKVKGIIEANSPTQERISISKKRKKSDKNVIKSKLEFFLNKSNPVSLEKVASELNTDSSYLRNHFNDSVKKIVANHQAELKKQASLRKAERLQIYRKTAEDIQNRGIKPTARSIMKELDHKMVIVNDRKECKRICKEVRQQKESNREYKQASI